jgi:hypothetical protein
MDGFEALKLPEGAGVHLALMFGALCIFALGRILWHWMYWREPRPAQAELGPCGTCPMADKYSWPLYEFCSDCQDCRVPLSEEGQQ